MIRQVTEFHSLCSMSASDLLQMQYSGSTSASAFQEGFERLFPIRNLFLNLSSHFIQVEMIPSLPLSIQCCHLSRQSWILCSPVVSLLGRSFSYHYVGFQVVEACLAQNHQLQDGPLRYFSQDIFLNISACIPVWKAD